MRVKKAITNDHYSKPNLIIKLRIAEIEGPEMIERDLETLASTPQEKALKMQFEAQKVIYSHHTVAIYNDISAVYFAIF